MSGSSSSQSSRSANASSSIGFGGDNNGMVGDGNTRLEDYSSTDNSMSYEDNSYLDTSSTDNSYTDNSMSYEDNSYNDDSITGDYNGNSGTVNVLDGGAIGGAFELGKHALTAVNDAMGDASLLSANSINQNTLLASNALAAMNKTTESSMLNAQMNSALVRDTAEAALEDMSETVFNMRAQAESTVLSSTNANQKALETTAKLMTTMNQNGNDLLIDGVVNIVKYAGIGIGSLGIVYGLVKFAEAKK